MNPPIHNVFQTLLDHYGEQHWWPAETRLEIMVGAILTQNTAWTNVDKALSNLKRNDALNFQALENVSRDQLIEWIRPAGFHNQKSIYIKQMISNLRNKFNGSIDELCALETSRLRKELLSWKGFGRETADCVVLYVAKKPAFVIDAYTKRICQRHGWIDEKAKYDDIAKLFTENLPKDIQLYNECHALIVQVCKDYCSARTPNCSDCPLNEFLLPN